MAKDPKYCAHIFHPVISHLPASSFCPAPYHGTALASVQLESEQLDHWLPSYPNGTLIRYFCEQPSSSSRRRPPAAEETVVEEEEGEGEEEEEEEQPEAAAIQASKEF
jgi:hypothetical protein